MSEQELHQDLCEIKSEEIGKLLDGLLISDCIEILNKVHSNLLIEKVEPRIYHHCPQKQVD